MPLGKQAKRPDADNSALSYRLGYRLRSANDAHVDLATRIAGHFGQMSTDMADDKLDTPGWVDTWPISECKLAGSAREHVRNRLRGEPGAV
jgi:hypothetical protein